MRGRVAYVGCSGVPTPRRDLDLVRLKPDAVFRVSLLGVRAVVLGPVAMRDLEPSPAWSALAPVRSRVVLCASPSFAHAVVTPWVTCGFGAPISGEDLADRLSALDRPHVRPWIEFDVWLPRRPAPGSPSAAAAAAVLHLPHLAVEPWATTLHWSEHRLRRLCRHEFGLTAKQVLLRYVAAAHRVLRAHGATEEDVASALGYFDAPTVMRAVGRGDRASRRATRLRETAQ